MGHEVFDPSFSTKNARRGTVPAAWNPLSELRITETHEWAHRTQENTSDPLLGLIDPKSRYPAKKFSGFRLDGFADIAQGGAYLEDLKTRLQYVELDEASVELISAKPNNDLFPEDKGFYSTYPDFHGNPEGVSQMAKRLNRVLDAARINPLALFNRHTNSKTSAFFYLMLQRTGLEQDEHFLVPLQVKALIDTIISGDPKGMQKYIDAAYKTTPD